MHSWLLNVTPWWAVQELTFTFASLRHLTLSTLRLAARRYRMKFTGIFASEWAAALFATSPEISGRSGDIPSPESLSGLLILLLRRRLSLPILAPAPEAMQFKC